MKMYKHTGPTRNQHCHWGSGEPTVILEGGRPPSGQGLGSSPASLCSWPDLVASAGYYWVCCLHTGTFPSQRSLLEASKELGLTSNDDKKRGETVAGQRPPCAFLSQPRVPGNAALALHGPRDTKHDRSAPEQSAHPTGRNKLSLRFRWFAIWLQVSETNLLRKLWLLSSSVPQNAPWWRRRLRF